MLPFNPAVSASPGQQPTGITQGIEQQEVKQEGVKHADVAKANPEQMARVDGQKEAISPVDTNNVQKPDLKETVKGALPVSAGKTERKLDDKKMADAMRGGTLLREGPRRATATVVKEAAPQDSSKVADKLERNMEGLKGAEKRNRELNTKLGLLKQDPVKNEKEIADVERSVQMVRQDIQAIESGIRKMDLKSLPDKAFLNPQVTKYLIQQDSAGAMERLDKLETREDREAVAKNFCDEMCKTPDGRQFAKTFIQGLIRRDIDRAPDANTFFRDTSTTSQKFYTAIQESMMGPKLNNALAADMDKLRALPHDVSIMSKEGPIKDTGPLKNNASSMMASLQNAIRSDPNFIPQEMKEIYRTLKEGYTAKFGAEGANTQLASFLILKNVNPRLTVASGANGLQPHQTRNLLTTSVSLQMIVNNSSDKKGDENRYDNVLKAEGFPQQQQPQVNALADLLVA